MDVQIARRAGALSTADMSMTGMSAADMSTVDVIERLDMTRTVDRIRPVGEIRTTDTADTIDTAGAADRAGMADTVGLADAAEAWSVPGGLLPPRAPGAATGSVPITMPAVLCGPPGVANGGWISGRVAGLLGGGPAEVTLRAPAPLGVEMHCEFQHDEARLYDPGPGAGVIVQARRVFRAPEPPPFVPPEAAAAAATRFPGLAGHPFPGCVVCGVDRPDGTGLFIHPGPVPGEEGLVAAVWRVGSWLAGPDGTVPRAAVWAALDCPTAWVHIPALPAGQVVLLGRITAQVHRPIEPERDYVVVARTAGTEGRKAFADAALYDTSGALVGVSRGTWIRVPASGS